jgi:hypothetical protein
MANLRWPELVIRFYEERISWQEEEPCAAPLVEFWHRPRQLVKSCGNRLGSTKLSGLTGRQKRNEMRRQGLCAGCAEPAHKGHFTCLYEYETCIKCKSVGHIAKACTSDKSGGSEANETTSGNDENDNDGGHDMPGAGAVNVK